ADDRRRDRPAGAEDRHPYGAAHPTSSLPRSASAPRSHWPFRLLSAARLPTVSTRQSSSASVMDDPVPGLREDLPEDRVDLLELLRVGDQRRRELDDGIAAVVGAADQPAPVELAGEEAAQQLLRLRVVERLLRLLVLDELDRLEVARPANVADDREL